MNPNSASHTAAVLQELPPHRAGDQSIVRLASSRTFVRGDVRVAALYEAMTADRSIQAVGVVNADDSLLGVIVRRDFLATMARPYAQDVLRNHPVTEVTTAARRFPGDSNTFTVSEEIADDMGRHSVTYYLLTWSGDRFAGVFSSQDMLMYLSSITQNDIDMARRLQARIVRTREISVGERLELVASSHTAKGVGGDFYKVIQYERGRWLVALCDVSGKGVAASIITSVLWGMMSIYDFRNGMLPFIRQVNSYLVRTFETEKFVTAVFLDYDEATGEVSVCDLGHSHLFLFRQGQMRTIRTNQNNLPLGISPDLDPRTDTFRPRPSDLLFVITDGLIEQANLEGDAYSLSRIAALFGGHQSAPVETISDRLLEDFNRFRGRRPLGDDVTWALMRFARQTVIL